MNLFYKKNNLNFFGSFLGVFVAAKTTKKHLGEHNFLFKDPVKKKLYFHKGSTFPHLQFYFI